MNWIKNTLNRYCKASNSSKAKVILTSRGFHALIFYKISNFLYEKNIPFLPLVLSRLIQIIYSIDIDYRAKIQEGLLIYHGIGLVIGSGVEIGKNCTIFHNVTLGYSFGSDQGMPKIGEGVFIGTGATVLGGINIGDKCKIGANSLVIKSCNEKTALLIGNPAKVVKIK